VAGSFQDGGRDSPHEHGLPSIDGRSIGGG
jgi:hypothetical protein